MAASFTDSIEEFINASDWLTPEDTPAVVALRRIAAGEDLPAARIAAERVLWLVDPAAAAGL